MRVKVGNTYYDPNEIPIMLILEKDDKALICAMAEDSNRIAFAPEDKWEKDVAHSWMNDMCRWLPEGAES